MKRWLPIIFAIALGATACGDGGETTAAGSETDEGPQSFEDLEYESPIMDFLGVDTALDFNSEESEAQFAEQANVAEEKIAQCMREEGFEYTPVDQSSFISFSEGEDGLPWGSREWAEKYGFGITTQRFSQSEVGPDLLGWDDTEMQEFDEQTDPNQAYVESLSQVERDAYYEALYGNEPELPIDATEADYEEAYENWEPTGCQAEAWGDEGFFGGPEQAFYEEFGDDIDDLYERLEADPRVAEHKSKVAACMAEKGLDYSGDMEELYNYFEDKMTGIGPDYSQDPFEAAGLDPETMTEEEIDAFYEEAFNVELSDADKETLGALQAEEIELATAVWDCDGSDLQLEILFSEIRVEYENEFLAENADRLGEFEGSAEG